MSKAYPSEDEMQAWADLMAAAERFDRQPSYYEALVNAIDALITARIDQALIEYTDRVEEATGVRP